MSVTVGQIELIIRKKIAEKIMVEIDQQMISLSSFDCDIYD